MGPIDIAVARTQVGVPRTAPTPTEPGGSDTAQTDAANHRTRPGLHAQSIQMADDLSALVTSMGNSRTRALGRESLRGAAWMHHMLDPQAPRKLDNLRQQLLRGEIPNLASLRTLLSQLFPDPSDQVAALRVLLADTELEVRRKELAELLDEVLDGPDGTRARAGVNAALKARMHAPALQATPERLRRSYQEFLVEEEPVGSYETWMALYGYERRLAVVDFIEQALAADMSSLDPSCSRLEFGRLLKRVRQLTTLRSADHMLLLHCWQPAAMTSMGLTPAVLTSGLLAMVRAGGGMKRLFAEVMPEVRVALEASARILLLQGLRRFMRALPHALWTDIGLHVKAMDEVDEMLDIAIDLEPNAGGHLHGRYL